MKRMIIATIVGAILAFLWGFVSWEILSWHQLDTFKDDDAVAQSISENAPTHGVYILPRHGEKGPNAKAITEGPFVYAIVRPNKLDSQWRRSTPMIGSFAIQIVGSFLIAIAIYKIRATRYISRASVGPTMGLFAGLVMALPYWNWFELPNSHTLAQVLDPFIAWTMAGLAIAAIIKTPKARRIFS